MSDAQPTPPLLAEQLRGLLSDVGVVKADIAVLIAALMRQDHALSALLAEVQAMNAQHGRLGHGVSEMSGA